FNRPTRGKGPQQGFGWPKTEIETFAAARSAVESARNPSEAAKFLRNLLAKGAMTSGDVKRLAKAKGFTKKALRRGRLLAGVLNDRMLHEHGPRIWYLEGSDPFQIQKIRQAAEHAVLMSTKDLEEKLP